MGQNSQGNISEELQVAQKLGETHLQAISYRRKRTIDHKGFVVCVL